MRYSLIFLIFIFGACTQQKKSDNVVAEIDGKALYTTNCANCHAIKEKLIGPPLQGVGERWQSKELLYDFIRNSTDVISRNDYAKKLFEEYKQSPMMPFPTLKNEEIEAILKYCDNPN